MAKKKMIPLLWIRLAMIVIALLIVLGTHIYLLIKGVLPPDQVKPHSLLNLMAGMLIIVELIIYFLTR